uniref:Uncharacterized protein n=1 Tax=Parascaris univalens TaxID=6257 RepID=A0A915C3R0_PARUN
MRNVALAITLLCKGYPHCSLNPPLASADVKLPEEEDIRAYMRAHTHIPELAWTHIFAHTNTSVRNYDATSTAHFRKRNLQSTQERDQMHSF